MFLDFIFISLSTNNNNWVYTYTSGKDYEDAGYTNTNGQEMTVNGVPYGTAYDTIKATNKYAPCFNGASSINKKDVTTTKYTYTRNSNGWVTSADVLVDTYSYDPTYQTKADGSGEYLAYVWTYATSATKGATLKNTYTKLGQPKKQTVTYYNEGQGQYIGQAYDENGNEINSALNYDSGLQKSDDADVTYTWEYAYGKDQQLAKRVYKGYDDVDDTLRSVSAVTTTLKRDDSGNLVTSKDSNGFTRVTVTTKSEPINKVVETTTYNSTLKDNSGVISAKTSDVRMTKSTVNGKDGDDWNDVVTYELKKISIPSSRETAVLMKRYLIQTDIAWK